MGVNKARVVVFVLVMVSLVVGSLPAAGQEPPDRPPVEDELPLVGELVNEAWRTLAPLLENETAQDLRQEEIDLELVVDILDADHDMVGIVFGGGAVEVNVQADLRLDFRAISIERLDDALRNATGDADVSLNSTFGIDSSRMVLTAEEVRLLGGGVVLQAFQGLQERAATNALEDLLPGITVLRADFSWSNTLPASYLQEEEPPDLREPPLVLQAGVTLRYLERYSLVGILEAMEEEDPDADREKDLRRRIEENQTAPPMERSAFMYLGYGQLLSMELPPGWRLNLTVMVPKGFTIEDSSAELLVDEDRRAARYHLDGSDRLEPFASAEILVLTNRFLVTTTVGAIALLAGGILRAITEGGVAGLQAVVRTRRK